MNLYLIGYRCCGKSTIGRRLSEKLEWGFLDMDDALVERLGSSLSEVVSTRGWPYFREMEKRLLSEIIRNRRHVIATGGGVILDRENVTAMKNSGIVVWLQVDPATAARRLASDERTGALRPALTDKPHLIEIADTLKERTPLYASAADIAIETDRISEDRACRQLADRLKAFGVGI